MLSQKPVMLQIKKILVFFIISFSNLAVLSQNSPKFEYISLLEGLSQSSVSHIVRDEYGYMWFATLDGLNKFDGYKVEVFRTNPNDSNSLADNSITCIYVSTHKEIWIGHKGGGISVFNYMNQKFTRIKANENIHNSLVANDIRTIQGDKNGNIWVGTAKGLTKVERKKLASGELKNKFIKFKFDIFNPYSIINDDINRIIEGSNSEMWIATNSGICTININTHKSKTLAFNKKLQDLLSIRVANILFQGDSLLWIATDNGLGKYNLKKQTLHAFQADETKFNALSSNKITDFALDFDTTLWIGTKDGLNHYRPKTNDFEVFKSSIFNLQGLNSSEITSLYIDSQKILWVGTSLGGVNKWNRPAKHFKTIRNVPFDSKSVASNRIRCFFQDRDSNVWIGTVDAGLELWNRKEHIFKHFPYIKYSQNSVSDPHVRAIAQDAKGRLWLGTDASGVDLFNYKTLTFKNFNKKNSKLTNNSIWAIFVDSKQRLWVGTLEGGLCVADLNQFDKTGILDFESFVHDEKNPTSISGNAISCIIEDNNSNLWIGTRNNGLNKLPVNSKEFKRYNFLPKNAAPEEVDRIYSILQDSEDTIWVATRGTLSKFLPEKDKFLKYDYFKYNIPNPVMMCLVEDQKKNIWISTNRGLTCFNKYKKTSRNYDVTDGLQSNEFMVGAWLKTSDGQILFGGQSGFNAFYSSDIADNPYEPKVLITNFLVFNKSFVLDTSIFEKRHIDLDYSQNTFTFEFVGIEYVNSLQTQYAYLLEGFEKDTIRVGNRRFASYTNLSPGTYTFKVFAANNDGKWNKIGKSIQIHIDRPFWLTPWFFAILFFIIVLISYFFIHLRDVYRDKNELEVKVVVRTKEVVQQKEAILKKNEELKQSQEEILEKNEELKLQQEYILEKNEELKQQQEEILAQRDALEQERDISEASRLAIMDSITYAQRIQNAILPPIEIINKMVAEHFILYKPQNIVSGDFYWMSKRNDKLIVTAADCTGHGVPGAFLSMLGISFLNEIVGKQQIVIASDILGHLRGKLIESLHQTGKLNEAKDGMDMSLCVIDTQKMELQFAGAFNPLLLCRFNKEVEGERELIEFKADRMPVGISDRDKKDFTNHLVKLKKNDVIYMFSDGYADQFGGPFNKKFKVKTFKDLLLQIFDKPLSLQALMLDETLMSWQGDNEQIDDILVLGIKM